MCANTFMKSIEILLVEDNPGDVDLALEAMADSKIINKIHVVSDGEEALIYLRQEGRHAHAHRPDLILLDLNIPRKSGMEVLAAIKSSDDLKSIPIVILTISKNEDDILRTYNLHANCFITKPIDLRQFINVVKSIENFWFTIVKLPPKEAAR